MAALFRKKKNSLDVEQPARKGRSQSLDPSSLAFANLKQFSGGGQTPKGHTLERIPAPEQANGTRSPKRAVSPSRRRASELFEGGLKHFQMLYKRRGSRERDEESKQDGTGNRLVVPYVPYQRPRSGSVDIGAQQRGGGTAELSRSLPAPQQTRRASLDPGLRIYSALRGVNGVRRNSVDANVKQFQNIYNQRRALKEEQATLMNSAAGAAAASPVSVSIPESPEITSRYHQPVKTSASFDCRMPTPPAIVIRDEDNNTKSHSTISSSAVNANLYRRHDDPFRRRSLSGGDALGDHNRMAILFRDSRGLPVVDPFLDTLHSNDLKDDESQIYVKFFKFHKCYDLIPTSAKLVVFDTQLLVKKAFFALVYNGVRAAPLWDSKRQQFVGMLTITDFIRILQMYYKHADEKIEELEEHKLDQWRTVLGYNSKPLIFIGPEESLYEAIAILLRNRIHRLPVIDPVSGDVLYIITHKRILRFLHLYISDLPRPSLMSRTLGELRVGSYDQIELAQPDTPVIEALTKFVNRRVSALPIVDHDGRLVHIYSKFDVINLAAEKTYNNLDVPLKSAISHRSENKVETCRLTDTFSQVLEKIVRAEVHRLVITDEDHRVIGVISLSDILDALVIRPHEYNIDLDLCDLGGETVGVLEDELGPDQQAGHHVIPEEEPGQEEEPSLATLSLAHRQA